MKRPCLKKETKKDKRKKEKKERERILELALREPFPLHAKLH
jgi:hypothetical protein